MAPKESPPTLDGRGNPFGRQLPPRTPYRSSASAPELPPLEGNPNVRGSPESPHCFHSGVAINVAKLMEQNALRRTSPKKVGPLKLDCAPHDVGGKGMWPPGRPLGRPAGAVQIMQDMRRPPGLGPKPGSPLWFAQDVQLERFDERIKRELTVKAYREWLNSQPDRVKEYARTRRGKKNQIPSQAQVLAYSNKIKPTANR